MITIYLLLWLLPIAGNVYLDRNGRKPNYLQMFIIRGFFAILHAILFNPHNTLDWIPILTFQVTSFWIFFELGLNIVRGNDWLYYDDREHDSGVIDRLFSWAGYEFHAIVKAIVFVFMILSIIVIYHRK
jgi:hypothetical protein